MNANWVNEIEQPQNPKIRKTIWGLFTIAFMAIAFFGWLISFNMNTIQQHHNQFLGNTLSDVTAVLVADLLSDPTPASLNELKNVANRLAKNPYVLDAIFYNDKGEVLAQSKHAKQVMEYSLSATQEQSPYRWYVSSIEKEQKQLGYLRITVNEALFEKPDSQSQTLITYAILSIVFIIAAISYYLAYYLHVERFLQPAGPQQPLIAEEDPLNLENLGVYLNRFSPGGINALIIIEWTNHSQNSPLHQVLLRAAKLYKGEYIALNRFYSIAHFTDIRSQHASQRTVQYLRLIKKLFETALPSKAHFRAGAHLGKESPELIFAKANTLCESSPNDQICISENIYNDNPKGATEWRMNRNALSEMSWILDTLDPVQESLLDRQVEFLLKTK